MAQKVIIDCDPGIDDAMALFMALAAQERGQLDILAITLVAGNTPLENCAKNAMRVLETVGKEDKVSCILLHTEDSDRSGPLFSQVKNPKLGFRTVRFQNSAHYYHFL